MIVPIKKKKKKNNNSLKLQQIKKFYPYQQQRFKNLSHSRFQSPHLTIFYFNYSTYTLKLLEIIDKLIIKGLYEEFGL